ncbi:mitochondrial ATP synthase epsilon chain-domain-containing protein [Chiua virens]|nr:mitochondrial ATP synthase epsilon chain-domain-containing protein [Chiua virens]
MSTSWRGVFSYNKYAQITARAVRQSLKETERVGAERRGTTALRYQKWENGVGGQQPLRRHLVCCTWLLVSTLGPSSRVFQLLDIYWLHSDYAWPIFGSARHAVVHIPLMLVCATMSCFAIGLDVTRRLHFTRGMVPLVQHRPRSWL